MYRELLKKRKALDSGLRESNRVKRTAEVAERQRAER